MASTPQLRIGLSGWSYPRWRGVFYPAALARGTELAYAAQLFTSVEINASFYRLQRAETFERWAQQTPAEFVFAVKGSRYITHLKRLESRTALANFFASGVLALGAKLGPLLWQLPPTLRFDPALIGPFLDLLPRSMSAAAELATAHDERVTSYTGGIAADRPLRHAIEVRHESFRDARLYDLLRERSVALVVADSAGHFPQIFENTAGFSYVRLHGQDELYTSGYDDASLRRWAGRIAQWRADGRDVYVYFDNDAKVRAPVDAMRLQELCANEQHPGRVSPGPDAHLAAEPR